VAKKTEREAKPPAKPANPTPSEYRAKLAEGQIKSLIEKGKRKGFLTYEEMNENLPEEAVTPNRLDSLLMTLDEMGITLLDEADVEKHVEEEEAFESSEETFGEEKDTDKDQLKDDELLEANTNNYLVAISKAKDVPDIGFTGVYVNQIRSNLRCKFN